MKTTTKLVGCCTCFLIYALLRYPEAMFLASVDSIQLWLTKVFPSLFPFLAACGLLLQIGAAQSMSRFFQPIMKPLFRLNGIAAFPFFLGIFSGYPMGAKITAMLYEKKLISLEEAQHILAFSNNAGPLFLIGTVGIGFFGLPFWGYTLLLCSFLGAVTTGFFWRKGKKISASSVTAFPCLSHNSLTTALSAAVGDAVNTILLIGGYLILFSALKEALKQTGIFSFLAKLLFFLPISEETLTGFCTGILEMTNGAYLLSLSSDPLPLRLTCVTFLISFGGLSILGQTLGILSAIPISKKDYIKGKCCNALCSSLFFWLLYPIFARHAKKAVPVFSIFTETAFTVSFLWSIPCLFFLGTLFYACLHRK